VTAFVCFFQIKAPVVDFHFKIGLSHPITWSQPQTGIPHLVPDELYIFDLPGSSEKEEKVTLSNTTEVNTWHTKYHWSGLLLFFLDHAHIHGQGYLSQMVADSETTLRLMRRDISLFKVDLWGPAVIKYEMQQGKTQSASSIAVAQSSLPLKRSTPAEINAYADFLLRFGTHYVSSAVFGGSLDMAVVCATSFVVNDRAAFDLQADLTIEFM
jgi:hypothetical protein